MCIKNMLTQFLNLVSGKPEFPPALVGVLSLVKVPCADAFECTGGCPVGTYDSLLGSIHLNCSFLRRQPEPFPSELTPLRLLCQPDNCRYSLEEATPTRLSWQLCGAVARLGVNLERLLGSGLACTESWPRGRTSGPQVKSEENTPS